jgi:Ser/Thr protein kinase RdoA (MazF antagonist)
MVTVDNAVSYLQAQELITADAAVDGDLDIISATRRNRNLRITTRSNGNFLIKQPNDRQSIAVDTLRREALFYAFCQREPAAAGLRQILPRLIQADLPEALLILELLRDAKPLWLYYEESETAEFPVAPAAAIGRALAMVHHLFRAKDLRAHPHLAFLGTQTPWALDLDRPTPEALAYLSGAQLQLTRVMQGQPDVQRQLEALRRAWKPETVIHGDVKLDNFVVVPGENGDQEPALYLVDWELVQRGDPAWDLGSALHDFLYYWVLSMDHDAPLAQMVARARCPLPAMHPAMLALWSAYCQARGLTPRQRRLLLKRAVRYSGVRVFQTAYEMARHVPVMPAPSVLMAQLGVNLLNDPAQALEVLYGLNAEGDPL